MTALDFKGVATEHGSVLGSEVMCARLRRGSRVARVGTGLKTFRPTLEMIDRLQHTCCPLDTGEQ